MNLKPFYSDFYIILYNSYKQTCIGLFAEDKLITSKAIDNKTASSAFAGTLLNLLKEHSLTFDNLSFIGVYQGPGPFTSLRVSIAFANGLFYALKIPLVGVDGFLASTQNRIFSQNEHFLVLFDAFCNEYYYALFDHTKLLLSSGYGTQEIILQQIKTHAINELVVSGEVDQLKSFLPTNTRYLSETTPTLEQIAAQAISNYNRNPHKSEFLVPLYLKRPAVYRNELCPSQP